MTQFDPDAPTETLTLNDSMRALLAGHDMAMMIANMGLDDMPVPGGAAPRNVPDQYADWDVMSESLKLFLHADR